MKFANIGGMRLRRKAGAVVGPAAFTMIEIAISLAVIGFALVAIISILPTGMNVQKDNREQTIINQDLSVFLEAIRNGERGLDDLTNYVLAITNYVSLYDDANKGTPVVEYGYTYSNSSIDRAAAPVTFGLTNGQRIIGLLSTPKFIPIPNPKNSAFFRSNYVVAFVRALSGAADEKYPQTNSSVQELAFTYRLISEVIPYGTNYFDPVWTNYLDPTLYSPQTNMEEVINRSNKWLLVNNIQTNNDFHDLRLTFRWPLLDKGAAGNGRQVFRTMIGGHLEATKEPGYPNHPAYTNYFFQQRNYVKTQ
jgi:type II secretory pathway pseudopilin PulG